MNVYYCGGVAHKTESCTMAGGAQRPRRAVELGETMVKLTGGITPTIIPKCKNCWPEVRHLHPKARSNNKKGVIPGEKEWFQREYGIDIP